MANILDKKGINITAQFVSTSPLPVDARYVCEDVEQMLSINEVGAAYPGLEIWLSQGGSHGETEYKTGKYLWNGGEWIIQTDEEGKVGATVSQSIPEDNVLRPNVEYFLGEIQEDILFAFPSSAAIGDMIYITFRTGEIVPSITINREYTKGLGELHLNLTHMTFEVIGLFDGDRWIIATNEADSNE